MDGYVWKINKSGSSLKPIDKILKKWGFYYPKPHILLITPQDH